MTAAAASVAALPWRLAHRQSAWRSFAVTPRDWSSAEAQRRIAALLP